MRDRRLYEYIDQANCQRAAVARISCTSSFPGSMSLLGAFRGGESSSARSSALTGDRRAAYDLKVELRITVKLSRVVTMIISATYLRLSLTLSLGLLGRARWAS